MSPRAPDDKKVKKQQLRNPKDDSDGQFDRFMKSYVGKDQQLYIVPRPSEYNSWKINFKGKRTPIGATGVWHDFTDRSQNFIMQGLTGCTAIIIVVSPNIIVGCRAGNADNSVVFSWHLGGPSLGRLEEGKWSRVIHIQIWGGT